MAQRRLGESNQDISVSWLLLMDASLGAVTSYAKVSESNLSEVWCTVGCFLTYLAVFLLSHDAWSVFVCLACLFVEEGARVGVFSYVLL